MQAISNQRFKCKKRISRLPINYITKRQRDRETERQRGYAIKLHRNVTDLIVEKTVGQMIDTSEKLTISF